VKKYEGKRKTLMQSLFEPVEVRES